MANVFVLTIEQLQLECLGLHQSKPGIHACTQQISDVSWQMSHCLHAGVTHANRPNFCQLELCFCKLDTDAASEVAKGCWPLLHS